MAKVANVTHYADQYLYGGPFYLDDESADCNVGFLVGSDQHYNHGLFLGDQCPDTGPPYTGSVVDYKVAVPAATVYNSVGVTVTGYTPSGEAMLYNGFYRVSAVDSVESSLEDLSGQWRPADEDQRRRRAWAQWVPSTTSPRITSSIRRSP